MHLANSRYPFLRVPLPCAVLMQWQPQQQDESYIVLLSLREAETLRRAMQAKSPSLPALILFTVAGEVLAQSAAARNTQRRSGASQMHVQRDHGRQCAKFFDCNMFYSNDELLVLLKAMSGPQANAAKRREEFFSGTKGSRVESGGKQVVGIIHGRKRRSVLEWEGTPVEALFQHNSTENFERTLRLATLARTALQAQWRAANPHEQADEDVPLEQLFSWIAGHGNSAITIAAAVKSLGEVIEASLSATNDPTLAMLLSAPVELRRALREMLKLVDRRKTRQIDFVQFARCFAANDARNAGDEDEGDSRGKRRTTSIEASAHGATSSAEGAADDTLVAGFAAMADFHHAQFPEAADLAITEGRPTVVSVPQHPTFGRPEEIGTLCATSRLEQAVVASGSDLQLSCHRAAGSTAADRPNEVDGKGLVSFAPRAVLLGNKECDWTSDQKSSMDELKRGVERCARLTIAHRTRSLHVSARMDAEADAIVSNPRKSLCPCTGTRDSTSKSPSARPDATSPLVGPTPCSQVARLQALEIGMSLRLPNPEPCLSRWRRRAGRCGLKMEPYDAQERPYARRACAASLVMW